MHLYGSLIFFLWITSVVNALFDPVSMIGGGVLIAGVTYLSENDVFRSPLKFLTKNVYEACSLSLNHFTKLEINQYLKERIYGQHIAIESITNALLGHLNDKHPNKPLVLSLHGWTGNGKNYITNLLIEKLYSNGLKSNFVHQFSGRIHFSKAENVENYKWELLDWVRGNASKCRYSIFVFDEVEKMPQGVLEPLKSVVDYGVIDRGIYNHCIFIFISNLGGESITVRMMELWKRGKLRSELNLKDFESVLSGISFEMNGGFQDSHIISSNLIDHYIPFLPMEKEHVELCIKDQFRSSNVNKPKASMIHEVMDTIEWGPEPINLFSKTGCKRIRQKVNLVINKYVND